MDHSFPSASRHGAADEPAARRYRRADLRALVTAVDRLAQGRLKLYLGFAPGSGKTSTLLTDAHALRRLGIRVLVGIAETHGDRDLEALLHGFDQVPPLRVAENGTVKFELDTTTIRDRAPDVVLVDDLAHVNAPGSARPYRYEDVLWLLQQGIHVHTTINVVQIESVASRSLRFLGTRPHHPVPDAIVEMADEIRVVASSPGKVLDHRQQTGQPNDVPPFPMIVRPQVWAAMEEAAAQILHAYREREFRPSLETLHGVPLRNRSRVLAVPGSGGEPRRIVRYAAALADSVGAEFHVAFAQTGASSQEGWTREIDKALLMAQEHGAVVHFVEGGGGRPVADLVRSLKADHVVLAPGRGMGPLSRWFRPSLAEAVLRVRPDATITLVGPDRKGGPWRAR